MSPVGLANTRMSTGYYAQKFSPITALKCPTLFYQHSMLFSISAFTTIS